MTIPIEKLEDSRAPNLGRKPYARPESIEHALAHNGIANRCCMKMLSTPRLITIPSGEMHRSWGHERTPPPGEADITEESNIQQGRSW